LYAADYLLYLVKTVSALLLDPVNFCFYLLLNVLYEIFHLYPMLS